MCDYHGSVRCMCMSAYIATIMVRTRVPRVEVHMYHLVWTGVNSTPTSQLVLQYTCVLSVPYQWYGTRVHVYKYYLKNNLKYKHSGTRVVYQS